MRFLCVCCAFASCFRKDVLDTEADRLFVRSTCSKVSGQAMSSYAKIDVSRCLEMSRVNSSSLSSPFSYSIQLQVTGEYHRIESHAPSTATAATACNGCNGCNGSHLRRLARPPSLSEAKQGEDLPGLVAASGHSRVFWLWYGPTKGMTYGFSGWSSKKKHLRFRYMYINYYKLI